MALCVYIHTCPGSVPACGLLGYVHLGINGVRSEQVCFFQLRVHRLVCIVWAQFQVLPA